MIEYDRSDQLANDDQGKHRRRAETRHHDDRDADEDGAEKSTRP